MFFVYDLLNSKEDYEPKKPWEREEHDMACEIHTTLFEWRRLKCVGEIKPEIFWVQDAHAINIM